MAVRKWAIAWWRVESATARGAVDPRTPFPCATSAHCSVSLFDFDLPLLSSIHSFLPSLALSTRLSSIPPSCRKCGKSTRRPRPRYDIGLTSTRRSRRRLTTGWYLSSSSFNTPRPTGTTDAATAALHHLNGFVFLPACPTLSLQLQPQLPPTHLHNQTPLTQENTKPGLP